RAPAGQHAAVDEPILEAFADQLATRHGAGGANATSWDAAVTLDASDAENAEPNSPDLVSGPEAAELLSVSRQRLRHLATAHPDFPPPLYKLRVGALWPRAAIQAFGAQWERKPGRPPKQNPS